VRRWRDTTSPQSCPVTIAQKSDVDPAEFFGSGAVSDVGLRALSQLKELREVYLNYTLVSANGLVGLSASHDLQVLQVGNSRITDDHAEQFDLFRHLHSLSLSGNGLSPSRICRAILNLKELGSFDADHTAADDSVATCLQRQPSLRVIDLSHTKLDDRGAAQLSAITTLEEVWLKETMITDAGVKSFRSLPRLAVLSLPVTLITDKATKDLAQIRSLRELYLGGTKITDQGIRDLSELPNLRTLFVPGCEGVTEASLEYFAAFPNLERISLSTTHISPEGLRHLVVIRPRISIAQ